MGIGQQLTLQRLLRLIPPPAPSAGLPLDRLTAASYFLGDWQDAQATTMEEQLFFGAACQWVTGYGIETSMPAPPPVPSTGPATDPRFALWVSFDPRVIAPLPVATALPGAAGAFLDVWGSAYGNIRWPNETDSNYALRILADIARPSTTNWGLGAIIDAALGLTGSLHCVVQDAAANSNLLRFNTQSPNQVRIGNSAFTPSVPSVFTPVTVARACGFVAGNSSLAGCFVVNVPLTSGAFAAITGSGITSTAWVNTLLNRRKAAGTQCTAVNTL